MAPSSGSVRYAPASPGSAQRGIGLLAQHHVADAEHEAAEYPHRQIERQIWFERTVWRLGGADQADIGLADGGSYAGLVGPPRHGFVELAVAIDVSLRAL